MPLFKGKPRRVHLQPIADKIKNKLAGWKGSMLSIMGRVRLVRAIIFGMISYNFHVYSWPKSLLNQVDGWIRNFVWSGQIDCKKLVIVSWFKTCSAYVDGGLELRSLKALNEAAMLELAREILYSSSQWSSFLKSRFIRESKPVSYYVQSSIWIGTNQYVPIAMNNTGCIIGDGKNINFWSDVWMDESFLELLNVPISLNLKAKVADFIYNGKWSFPSFIHEGFPAVVRSAQQVVLPLAPDEDKPIWKNSETGVLTFKEAYFWFRPIRDSCPWGKIV